MDSCYQKPALYIYDPGRLCRLEVCLFVIIPSSVHELLAVRTDGVEPEKVKKMIRDMNSTQIDPEEILSYSLYRFDRQSKTIRIVT